MRHSIGFSIQKSQRLCHHLFTLWFAPIIAPLETPLWLNRQEMIILSIGSHREKIQHKASSRSRGRCFRCPVSALTIESLKCAGHTSSQQEIKKNNAIACFLYFEAVTWNLSFIGHIGRFRILQLHSSYCLFHAIFSVSRQFPVSYWFLSSFLSLSWT